MHQTLLEEILTNVIRIKLYRWPRSLGTQDVGVKLFSGTQISSICFFLWQNGLGRFLCVFFEIIIYGGGSSHPFNFATIS